ncbi:Rne/Rng family ribonuclease, partial [Actinomadura nitritigenes]|uniref:Rne/Rng family ribonuclease n=1 Tax=Actinomadura nitritigenes TaxID=134602 RepID=UPI0031E3CF87
RPPPRRRRSGVDGESGGTDDPPNTVVHVRSAREERAAAEDEVQSVRGSTRLEAKKQRRREGREQGRRRPPVITEAEFLARRESVERVMVVRQAGERTQIAVLEDDVLVEHYVNRATHQSYVGNVYLGKVQNVLPSMEAAFVDIGKGRNAVLYAGEVNWDVAGLVGQPRRIESALKSGQSVLVQVTKDPLGHKGARLTSQVSLPGRYLVYVPDGSMTGISRKLPDKERSRLKSILKKVMPENAGVIVRTAAEGATEEELGRDVSRLAAQWESIQKKVKTASAPSLLYGEPDLTIRVVRDIFNEDFTKLVVAGDGAWDTVSEYVEYVAPHLADRVERWTGDQDVLGAFRIDEQIAKALDRKVWLPSGGSLVIDKTEAMTVIDVNTGKFTGQGGNLEETVTRNNLEAAEEIVRQLRLRDIGGIIVIDFIDMVLESNRDLVLRRLVECLSRDRTKHQVAEVTSLGLVQMTRKRVGQGLVEAFSETCESCNGRGIHVHLTPVEPKPDKAAGKEAGRRRKRKGEVEKAVEEKLAQHEAKKEPAEPAPAEEPEAARPEPVRSRPKKSGPAKRPAGPPPEVDGEEAPAQAAVEAADAAEEVEGTSPGILDDEPVAVSPNGTAPAEADRTAPAEANGAAPAAEPAEGEQPVEEAPRRRRARRPRATAQAESE